MSSSPLANLPRVDRVAGHGSLDGVRRRLGSEAVARLVRRAIEEARQAARGGAPCPGVDDVARRVLALAGEALSARARPVINATGVVLHTNLGRAPLPASAVLALEASAGRYTSIEIDLDHLAAEANSDVAGGELCRSPGHQIVNLGHLAAHHVRFAAR